jgi:hypothetical protein
MIPLEEHFADMAYTVYCQAVGGYAFNGDKLPTWDEFKNDPTKQKQVAAWIAVGRMIQLTEERAHQ